MKTIMLVAFLVGLAIADEKYTTEHDDFDVDTLATNPEELKKFSGCFLDKNECNEVAEHFKKDLPEVFAQACGKCTDAQKHLLKKFLDAIKEKLPEDYEDFKKKFDPEGKYFGDVEKAINA
uniref:Chemosensory protein 10 n=1 Tax=Heortia vitessoides TaxID=1557813 RepID=A0A3G6V7H6_9NEOP|nr:chemosensory protein 10 [Heortia vitessoides]